MAFGITDLKKGQIFQLDSHPYKVVDYNQKVMGRGGSIVNVRIKSLIDGKVLAKTLRVVKTLNRLTLLTRQFNICIAMIQNITLWTTKHTSRLKFLKTCSLTRLVF